MKKNNLSQSKKALAIGKGTYYSSWQTAEAPRQRCLNRRKTDSDGVGDGADQYSKIG